MCCKNECLKVCPSGVLQGHNSNICLASTATFSCSPFLPPLWWLSWGSRNRRSIMGFMPTFQVSFLLQRTHKPSLHKVQPGLLWYPLGFLCRDPYPTQWSPRSSPIPKTDRAIGVFHKTELLQENCQDQNQVAVLSHGFHSKYATGEGDWQKPGGLISVL